MHTTREAEAALRALAAPDQRGQGRAAPEVGEVDADRLGALEEHAVSVRAWNPGVVPGLCQTLAYAAGAIKTAVPALPSEEIQRRALRRGQRIAAWSRRLADGGGTASFILGEPAVNQPLVNAHTHGAMLAHLLEMSARPGVRVQILLDGTPTPGRFGQFTLYGLQPATQAPLADERPRGTRVGYLETPVGAWYTTRSEDIARLHSGFADITRAALSVGESQRFIQEELACWTPHTTWAHRS